MRNFARKQTSRRITLYFNLYCERKKWIIDIVWEQVFETLHGVSNVSITIFSRPSNMTLAQGEDVE